MRFLGMAGFYRRFCRNFSTLAAPLTDLTSSSVPFHWTPACDQAVRHLKAFLLSSPVVWTPDHSHPFQLQIDASGVGIGAVLLQKDPLSGILHPVAYHSAKLKKHQSSCVTSFVIPLRRSYGGGIVTVTPPPARRNNPTPQPPPHQAPSTIRTTLINHQPAHPPFSTNQLGFVRSAFRISELFHWPGSRRIRGYIRRCSRHRRQIAFALSVNHHSLGYFTTKGLPSSPALPQV
ncbi:POL4 [Enterospora canceri]|uniref:POL4 n=1 Tax=Enterospora canceri TaxID=1081671 RepID=A0A1Y1S3Y3_9MICR|nr:POL4 [Enterospora canceri]